MKKRIFTFIAALVFSASFNYSSAAILSVPASALTSKPDSNTVKTAVDEFKSLSRKEKRALAREAKKEIKLFKAEKRRGNDGSTNTLLLVIVAILLPPLAVYLHEGEINNRFWIDLLLTLLFYLPGLIYALVIILGNN
jgi:uncharacterized membrane protein YqaE (UPF0057 family)